MAPLTKVAQEDRGEIGVAARGGDGDAVADRPEDEPGQPLLKAEPDRGGDRAVDDRDAAGGAAQQNRLAEAPVNGSLEPIDVMAACADHQTSAPPPNEKNDRKKDEAAKAIERPNTI